MEDCLLQEVIGRMKKRYGKEIRHHADCSVYSHLNICDCGLHHDIMPYVMDLESVFPSQVDDFIKHDVWRCDLILSLHQCSADGSVIIYKKELL